MAIEVSGGLPARLESFKKRTAERTKAKAQKRLDKRLRQGAYAPPDGKIRQGYSAAYAEGWDRIFGRGKDAEKDASADEVLQTPEDAK